jgi:hypothetical protein
MHLEVVGTNRAEIHQLSVMTRKALRGKGLTCEVREVTRPEDVAQHPSLPGPGIFIDGVLACSSRSIRPEDIVNMVRWRHPQAMEIN